MSKQNGKDPFKKTGVSIKKRNILIYAREQFLLKLNNSASRESEDWERIQDSFFFLIIFE